MENAKLIKKIKYRANIELLSGLHIGGTNIAMAIGGPDKFVVRNPIDQKPYIPGSSLKGKMRSLLEIANGEYEQRSGGGNMKFSASSDNTTLSGHLFGTSAGECAQPSRVIVRDAMMADGQEERLRNTDLYLTEAKTEVAIDRITANANPRTNERVPKGVIFCFEAILNIFSTDDEQQLRDSFIKAVKLLEDDYLGGHGSRGYGHIRFVDWQEEEKLTENY